MTARQYSVRYLISSDLTLDFVDFTTIYQKRWKVEEYHIVPFGYRSLKQNASLAQSPTRTETTQTNHFVAAMWAWCKLELLCVRQPTNVCTQMQSAAQYCTVACRLHRETNWVGMTHSTALSVGEKGRTVLPHPNPSPPAERGFPGLLCMFPLPDSGRG